MLMALVRHGSVGSPPFLEEPALDETGRIQIHDLAKKLGREDWQSVISSPLARAMQSAEILRRDLRIPFLVEDALRERAHGPLEGRVVAPCAAGLDFLTKMTGREELGVFMRRVVHGFLHLASSHAGRKVIVVTHGGVIKVFHGAVLRKHVGRIEHASPFLVELGISSAGELLASQFLGSFSEEDKNGGS